MYDTVPPPSLSDKIGKGVLPGVYDEDTDPNTAVNAFLRESVDLLANKSVYVRESVKEALGNELPFALLQVITMQMTQSADRQYIF